MCSPSSPADVCLLTLALPRLSFFFSPATHGMAQIDVIEEGDIWGGAYRCFSRGDPLLTSYDDLVAGRLCTDARDVWVCFRCVFPYLRPFPLFSLSPPRSQVCRYCDCADPGMLQESGGAFWVCGSCGVVRGPLFSLSLSLSPEPRASPSLFLSLSRSVWNAMT